MRYPKKILYVHNRYAAYSGEEWVFDEIVNLFREKGYDVDTFEKSSSTIDNTPKKILAFLTGIINFKVQKEFSKKIKMFQPDIIHIHNLYPIISPGILYVAKNNKIPVVMTVHNFRLFCPSGLFMTNGHICEECAIRMSFIPCIKHNCLKSRIKSIAYAARAYYAYKSKVFFKNINLFFCLTNFQKNKLVSYGLNEEKCRIIPNFIKTNRNEDKNEKGEYIAYIGRISHEKGIDILLNAAKELPEYVFKIAGFDSSNTLKHLPDNVEYMGYLSGESKTAFIRNARIIVMCSKCYENFPSILLEAMAFHKPTIVPNIGGLPEIIGDSGMVYDKRNRLSSVISLIMESQLVYDQLRKNTYEQIKKYEQEKVFELIKKGYIDAINQVY